MRNFSPKSASVIFMLLAVSLFAGISLVAKSLGTGSSGPVMHPVQVSAGRFCFALLVLTPLFLIKKPGFTGVPWGLHFARSVSGWLGITCMFIAATKIPLADANAISFMSVIVTMALSIPLLGEQVGVRRWTAAGIAFVGALILIKPGTEAFHPAAIVALLAALFVGLEAILVKKLSNIEPPLRILFINNSVGALISLIVALFFWISPTIEQWLLLAGIGITMVLIQTCFIQAISRMEASFVTPFWYAVPLFAALFDLWLFEQYLSTTSTIGILLITMGGVVICRRSKESAK